MSRPFQLLSPCSTLWAGSVGNTAGEVPNHKDEKRMVDLNELNMQSIPVLAVGPG